MSISTAVSTDTIYSVRLDDYSSTVVYVGEAAIGADENSPIWRIKLIDTSGSVTSIKWADGNQRFDNIWTNRVGLSYA